MNKAFMGFGLLLVAPSAWGQNMTVSQNNIVTTNGWSQAPSISNGGIIYGDAPGGPPSGFFPPGMKNTGTRYNRYCLDGEHHVCVERRVLAWGQVCSSGSDKDNIQGVLPPGFHYVSWRCETSDPADKPPQGKSGK